ncbi:large subunit rRNA processing RRM protein, putative [Plasmodium gallinaceum]|uniref:Large subunit rRNA processing RRM protein, putative n=1 Tax=Plasmodium gallinaceum TaxID=5849 RepID=A0A1J1H1M4_PLAGA|nr:large subunit rRNA processing RRM protein, putative [Plasmodium gallinaceum]CRG97213.1 large subunit rRNA processing RRM protein, putative [Plasmodium gallinaceum]
MKKNKDKIFGSNTIVIKKKTIEKEKKIIKEKKKKNKIKKENKSKNTIENSTKDTRTNENNTKNLTEDYPKISKKNKKYSIKQNETKKKPTKVSKILKKLSSKNEPKKEKISSVVEFLNKNETIDSKINDKKNDKKITMNINSSNDKELKVSKKPLPQNKDGDKSLEKNKRTVFVGNIPLKNVTGPKLLKILNIKRSLVESIRFRSLPLEEKYANKKKLGVILKKFTDAKDNKNALITLKEEDHVPIILSRNGTVYDGYVLRVNRIGDNSFFNKKKSVCIRNLHKQLNEKDLYELMKDVDEIKGIRILRDNITSCSTGVAFILFKNRSSVKKAIEMFNGKMINNRPIVVQKVLDRNEIDNAKKKNKEIMKKEINKKFKKYRKKKKKYFRKKNRIDNNVETN